MDNKKRDEYLSLDQYGNKPSSDKYKDFSSFNHAGEHYFALLKDGKPVMRSEGYSSAKSRDNGIESVRKNRNNRDRWSVVERAGKFFLSLKAGNNQEIALSGAYDSKAAAESALSSWLSGGSRKGGKTAATTAAAAAGLAGGGAKMSKDVVTEEDKEDDYLPTAEYEGHPINDKKNNIAHFKHENGQYYFALYNKEGKVKLRSEGFETAKNRDQELSGVLKYHNDDKMYSTLERGKFYMMVLKDETGREVGRSPLLKKKAGAPVATKGKSQKKGDSSSKSSKSGIVAGTTAAASGLAAGRIISTSRNQIGETRNQIGETRNQIGETRNVIGEKRNVIGEKRNTLSETKSKVKEDDYLKCEAYKGHKITDTKNRVAEFKGPDGQYYFAVYDKDGAVRLRSEGFKTEAGRKDELKQVINHKETEKMYSTIKKGKYYINVLKDKTGREVARSCMSTAVTQLVAPVLIPVPPPPPKKKVAAVSPKPKPVAVKKTPPPPPKKVIPVKPVAAAPVVAEKGAAGCLKYWWLLLLLLIPLLLWWLGCFAAAPPVVAPVVAPVVTPPPPPPPVVKTCDCASLTHPVFTVPSGPAPKTTTRLGIAPEFGNSSSLDGAGFYNKLKSRYAGSATDRRFLDGVFKQMGYENGFSDAKADLFSSVTIPRGVSGNLGMKSSHTSVHRKLDPTDAKDLRAFRVTAANECHLHFMKTCGNHFFYNDCE